MKFIFVIFFALFITSCSINSDQKKINDRISLLSYSSELLVSSNLNSSDITLSAPKEIYYWSQSGQNPQNNLPNIFSNLKFENKEVILKDKDVLVARLI